MSLLFRRRLCSSKMGISAKAPTSVRLAQALFLLIAVIWFLLGVGTLIRTPRGNPDQAIAAPILAFFMAGNACAMLGMGVGLGKRQKRFYYLAILVLAVNIILTFTDEFGLLDFATLIIDGVLLELLIAS